MNTHTRAKHRSTRKFLDQVYKPSLNAFIPSNFNPEVCNIHLDPEANKDKAKEAFYFILNRICTKNGGNGNDFTPKFCEPVKVNHTLIKQILAMNALFTLEHFGKAR